VVEDEPAAPEVLPVYTRPLEGRCLRLTALLAINGAGGRRVVRIEPPHLSSGS